MTYWIIAIIFFVISAALFISSFFVEDNTADIQEEVEEFTLGIYQDMAQIRTRLDLIEEELNMGKADHPVKENMRAVRENQVVNLYTRGRRSEEISEVIGLPVDAVDTIINDYISNGSNEGGVSNEIK